jgi:enamine deaminase RidA (YjgF/YER057c/UK114 family)
MLAVSTIRPGEAAMITRLPDHPTRCEGVAWDKLVTTVCLSEDKSQGMYAQAKEALANIDINLEKLGSHKSKILTAMVYIADIALKSELNRAWDEWADRDNPPMRACVAVTLEARDLVEIIVTATR